MTSYTSTQVRFVNAYKNCTLADLAGIPLHIVYAMAILNRQGLALNYLALL